MLGELAIDYEQRRVSVAGRAVELTVTEYELLRVLSLKAGQVATFESLLHQVWNKQGNGDPKLVRAFIKMIRQKLGDDSRRPRYIFNCAGSATASPGRTRRLDPSLGVELPLSFLLKPSQTLFYMLT